MATLKMHKLIERWTPSVLFLFLIIKFLQFLKKIGFKLREDGWRKITSVYLRTEHSKFVLACFRLNFWSQLTPDENKDLETKKIWLIKTLVEFFRQQPSTHWKIDWFGFSAKRIKKGFIDFVLADFNLDGSLQNLVPYLDKFGEISIGLQLQKILIQGIIKFYNETKDLGDKRRPLILKKKLNKWVAMQLRLTTRHGLRYAQYYVARILSATFIHFEETIPWQKDTVYSRLETPDFIKHKHPGFGFLNIICRLSNEDNEADLWFQCNHISLDGVAMQEVLQELKRRTSNYDGIKFPASSHRKESIPQLCSTQNMLNGVYHVRKFINFSPLLKIRKEISKRNINEIQKGLTAFRLIIWKLGTQPVFRNTKFLIPVDVPSSGNRERTLSFVLIRPGAYLDKYNFEKGFFDFQKEFNRQAKAAIRRRSESYELLENYTLFPSFMYTLILKLMPSAVRELVGTIGISIINKADLFIAPFSDVHTGGFISFSNFFIPTEDNDIACYVSVKGPKDKIDNYMKAIIEVASPTEH